MPQINLKKVYYYLYPKDTFIEVSDEVAEALLILHRAEEARNSKIRYHKAYYSLDCDDGIENHILNEPAPSPEEIYLEKEEEELLRLSLERLNEAINHLTPIQARRIRKRYLLGMKIREIAEQEGVSYRVVFETLRDSLTKMRKYFDKRKWRLHEE